MLRQWGPSGFRLPIGRRFGVDAQRVWDGFIIIAIGVRILKQLVAAVKEVAEGFWIDESRYVGIIPPIALMGGVVGVAVVCRVLWLIFLRGRLDVFHHILRECPTAGCHCTPRSRRRLGDVMFLRGRFGGFHRSLRECPAASCYCTSRSRPRSGGMAARYWYRL